MSSEIYLDSIQNLAGVTKSGVIKVQFNTFDGTSGSNVTPTFADMIQATSITPTYTTSKIIIITNVFIRCNVRARMRILRNATAIYDVSEHYGAYTGYGPLLDQFMYVDTPNTTSTVTYYQQIALSTAGAWNTNDSGSMLNGYRNSMILIEVAA